jgi:hypothetical protein
MVECLSTSALYFARRGVLVAAALHSSPVDHHRYLAPRERSAHQHGASCDRQEISNRTAVFGVTDPSYLPRYWTTFASLDCHGVDVDHGVDLFLLVHSALSLASGGDPETWARQTPPSLRDRIAYVPIDFSECFEGSSYHSSWPSVAYWWAAAPEMFREAGYAHAIYLDGDILAARPGLCPMLAPAVMSMLSPPPLPPLPPPATTISPGFVGARDPFRPGGLERRERLVAAAPESSLGVMLVALGADQKVLDLHDDGFGVGLGRHDRLLTTKLVTTSRPRFSLPRSDSPRPHESCAV